MSVSAKNRGTLPDAPVSLSDADLRAAEAVMAAEPVWADLAPARDAFGLDDGVVLHAGPPVGDSGPCPAVENSAAMAVLYEGWAKTDEEARGLLTSGEIALKPAQDFNAAVPLASVLTAGMQVHVVADRKAADRRAYSPINGGNGPALRLGQAGPQVVDHLRWLNGEFADVLAQRPEREMALLPIAADAIAQGDDCHGRTPAATKLVAERVLAESVSGAVRERAEEFLSNGPSFFLNIWMAASKCCLLAGGGVAKSSLITAIGGNGNSFGIKLSGLGDRWFTAPASAPVGALEDGFSDDDRLGAIGDSAIVDALGFGAMAMAHAPAQEQGLGGFMPPDWRDLGSALMAGAHPGFRTHEIFTGLTARRVVAVRRTPTISLGVLDRRGRAGRIGGGIFEPSLAPFEQAIAALEEE